MDRIDVEDLVALVRNYNPRTNEDLIRRAYDYGRRMHEGQFRHSGEPYFTHPVAVAAILTEMRLDDATIVTALLHDTIEDTVATHEEIQAKFGENVARLVEGAGRAVTALPDGCPSRRVSRRPRACAAVRPGRAAARTAAGR